MSAQQGGPPASAYSHAESIRDDIFSQIADTDLQDPSKDLLRNLLTKDLVLANLKEAEVTEWRWRLRTKKELFFAAHPQEGDLVVGRYRKAIYDDETAQNLMPLDDFQRMAVHDLFDTVETRITRARKMRQQRLMKTTIQERKVDDGEKQTESKGGLRGVIPGL